MARAPNEKAAKAEAMYYDGMKLVDIAKKLDVPPGTIRRWKSTYRWGNEIEKKQSERSDNENERSDKKAKSNKGGQKGNTNALKNATYATEYWKNISDAEREMMKDMPVDEEFQLIEALKLTVLRESRYMAFLARYQKLMKNSPDGMVLKEDIKIMTQEILEDGNRQSNCKGKTLTAQQTKVDAVEQMQIIESELTRVQKVKVKIIETLSKIHDKKVIDNDDDLVDEWVAGVKESEECE